MAPLPGLGLFGTVFATRKRKPLTRKSILFMSVLSLLIFISLFSVGCGSGSKAQAPASQATLMVTGTSGAITHSSAVTININ
jgi:hypothetical protein